MKMSEKQKKTTVFYFSCIPYDSLYQRPQQLFREWRSHFEDSFDLYYFDFPNFTDTVVDVLQTVLQSIREKELNKRGKTDSHIIKGRLYPPRGIGEHRLPPCMFDSPFHSRYAILSSLKRSASVVADLKNEWQSLLLHSGGLSFQ
jgi:thymidylate synthase